MIGRGGMGAVYLAKRQADGTRVALKVMLARADGRSRARGLPARDRGHALAPPPAHRVPHRPRPHRRHVLLRHGVLRGGQRGRPPAAHARRSAPQPRGRHHPRGSRRAGLRARAGLRPPRPQAREPPPRERRRRRGEGHRLRPRQELPAGGPGQRPPRERWRASTSCRATAAHFRLPKPSRDVGAWAPRCTMLTAGYPRDFRPARTPPVILRGASCRPPARIRGCLTRWPWSWTGPPSMASRAPARRRARP